MKLIKFKILIICIAFTLTAKSFAQWFPARAKVLVLPGQVSAEVFNPYFRPIICSGQVFGETTYRNIYTSYFARQILPAGSYRFAYVRTNAFAPFIRGWANIYCRFAGIW